MFKKKEEAAANFDNISTFISKDAVVTGKINGKSTMRIDGKVEGEINCSGDIVIGESGVVESNIKVRHILIAGKVRGSIDAQGKVEMASTGSVIGDISVSSLIIDDGAAFEGKCIMQKGSGSRETARQVNVQDDVKAKEPVEEKETKTEKPSDSQEKDREKTHKKKK